MYYPQDNLGQECGEIGQDPGKPDFVRLSAVHVIVQSLPNKAVPSHLVFIFSSSWQIVSGADSENEI